VNASRPVLWGVLNVTPDSFSDGGEFFSHDRAIAQATLLVEHGVRAAQGWFELGLAAEAEAEIARLPGLAQRLPEVLKL
jgi:dihydropteroate synthase